MIPHPVLISLGEIASEFRILLTVFSILYRILITGETIKSKPDQNLKKIIKALKEEFNPSRLFLFGSRANGTHRADSDYDFVMVVPGLKNRFTAETKARLLAYKATGIPADIFIYNQKDFDDWKDELSSIPETAINTGKELDLG